MGQRAESGEGLAVTQQALVQVDVTACFAPKRKARPRAVLGWSPGQALLVDHEAEGVATTTLDSVKVVDVIGGFSLQKGHQFLGDTRSGNRPPRNPHVAPEVPSVKPSITTIEWDAETLAKLRRDTMARFCASLTPEDWLLLEQLPERLKNAVLTLAVRELLKRRTRGR